MSAAASCHWSRKCNMFGFRLFPASKALHARLWCPFCLSVLHCSTGLHDCAEMQRIPVSAAGHSGRVTGQGLHSWAEGSAASCESQPGHLLEGKPSRLTSVAMVGQSVDPPSAPTTRVFDGCWPASAASFSRFSLLRRQTIVRTPPAP